MSAPPAKKFTEEKAPRGGDEARSFEYFKPQKRRASQYEDVTIDTQPSPLRHMNRGWLVSFEDGRGTWDEGSTKIKSTDWFEFRDPGQMWERNFYQAGAGYERQIEGAVRAATDDGLFADYSEEWVEFLRRNLQIPAFVEHGLWLATATIARDCLSDSVAHAVVMQASLKQRLAQSIVLYALDLEPHFGELPTDQAKQRFLHDPTWQPTRAFLEELRVPSDWMEVLIASNLCFEPLVGVLIRRELGIRAAAANGDTVTPTVARVGQQEWKWISDWTAELVRFLIEDEIHGDANRELISGWVEKWMPKAREAAEALSGMAGELPIEIPFEAALERVLGDAEKFHAGLGLNEAVAGVNS